MSLFTRRRFLHTSAATALTAASWGRVYGANDRLRVASVGVGGRGWSDLSSVKTSPNVTVTGLCDIDSSEKFMGRAAKTFTEAQTFSDWRKLLDAPKLFDALIVATPDHMHAPVSLPALQLGKHVCCQKPLTHTVHEARQMKQAAAKYGVVTQMGNQIQSHEAYRTAVKLIQSGVIGKITAVHSWQAGRMQWFLVDDRPAGSDPIPETVLWDNWLGVAPARPYKKEIYHSFNWRAFQDFSNGQLGDFGCHILDPVFTALKFTAPTTIQAEASPLNKETWHKWSVVKYQFPSTPYTVAKSIPVTWYDGVGKIPTAEQLGVDVKVKLPTSGSLLIGEKGMVIVPHIGPPKLLPEEKFADYKVETVPGFDHFVAWADACRGVGKTGSSFDYSGPLTETVLLGAVAIRVPGEKLTWDAAGLKITNNAAADKLIRKPYRSGWEPKWVA